VPRRLLGMQVRLYLYSWINPSP